jgi:hypothetical protein
VVKKDPKPKILFFKDYTNAAPQARILHPGPFLNDRISIYSGMFSPCAFSLTFFEIAYKQTGLLQ